jgi:hypothetical protein
MCWQLRNRTRARPHGTPSNGRASNRTYNAIQRASSIAHRISTRWDLLKIEAPLLIFAIDTSLSLQCLQARKPMVTIF